MPGKGRKKQGRARKGTGSIREMPGRPGYYAAEIGLGTDSNGKRIRKTVTGRSPEEVETKLEEIKKRHRAGLPVANAKITVQEHFEDWLRSKKADIASSTHASYTWQVDLHIVPALGKYKLKALDYRLINVFYEDLDKKELSRRTVAYIAKVLRMGLHDAVRKRLIPENPASLAAKRTPGKKEARFMTHEEVAAFLRAAKGERLAPLFDVMLETGMRPGEALGLPWDAVNLDERTIDVRQALHEEGALVYIGELKGESANQSIKRRTIKISHAAAADLRRQRKAQNEEKMKKRKTWTLPQVDPPYSGDLVFTNTLGGLLRRTHIMKREVKRVKERAAKALDGAIALQGVGLHTFRHTHAAFLLFDGVDIKVVSERLGHTSVTFTYDTYGHLLPGSDEKAADAMDRIMAAIR